MKQKTVNPSTIGQHAEQAALQFLTEQGLSLITRNYLFKGGEIDLIMHHNQQLIFIEVRFRSHASFGSGAESVTRAKQQKISKTALHFLQKQPQYAEHEIRFDVLSLSMEHGQYKYHWIEEAFWPGDG